MYIVVLSKVLRLNGLNTINPVKSTVIPDKFLDFLKVFYFKRANPLFLYLFTDYYIDLVLGI